MEAFENQRLTQEYARIAGQYLSQFFQRLQSRFKIPHTRVSIRVSEQLLRLPHFRRRGRRLLRLLGWRRCDFLRGRLQLHRPGDLLSHQRDIVPGHRKQLDDRKSPKQADCNDKRDAYRLPGYRRMWV